LTTPQKPDFATTRRKTFSLGRAQFFPSDGAKNRSLAKKKRVGKKLYMILA
jgi:hypothetical protein